MLKIEAEKLIQSISQSVSTICNSLELGTKTNCTKTKGEGGRADIKVERKRI